MPEEKRMFQCPYDAPTSCARNHSCRSCVIYKKYVQTNIKASPAEPAAKSYLPCVDKIIVQSKTDIDDFIMLDANCNWTAEAKEYSKLWNADVRIYQAKYRYTIPNQLLKERLALVGRDAKYPATKVVRVKAKKTAEASSNAKNTRKTKLIAIALGKGFKPGVLNVIAAKTKKVRK